MILKEKEVSVARNCRCGVIPKLVLYRSNMLNLWYIRCSGCGCHSPGRLHSVQAELLWNKGNQIEPKDAYVNP